MATKKTTPKTSAPTRELTVDQAVENDTLKDRAKNQPAPQITAPVPAPTDELAGKPTIAVKNKDGVFVPVRFDPVDDAQGLANDD